MAAIYRSFDREMAMHFIACMRYLSLMTILIENCQCIATIKMPVGANHIKELKLYEVYLSVFNCLLSLVMLEHNFLQPSLYTSSVSLIDNIPNFSIGKI